MTLDEMLRQRGELLSTARAANEKLSELKGDEADAKLSEVNGLMSQLDKLDEQIAISEKLDAAEKLSEERRETTQRIVENGGDLKYRRETPGSVNPDAPKVTVQMRRDRQALWDRYHAGEKLQESDLVTMRTRYEDEQWFANFLRGGPAARRTEQFVFDPQDDSTSGALSLDDPTALGTGAMSNSAHVVPLIIWNEVVQKMKHTGPMLQLVRTITTDTGAPLKIPTFDNTGNEVAVVAEGSAPGPQDVTFTSVDLPVYRVMPKDVIVTGEMVQDAGLNVEAFIIDKLGQEFGRGINKLLLVGTGTNQPQGVSTAVFALTGAAARNTAAAAATGPTLAEVVGIFDKIDPMYESEPGFALVTTNTTRHTLRTTRTTAGDYIWQNSLQAGVPGMLLGVPVFVDSNFGNKTGNQNSLLGAFSRHFYRIARQMTVARLVETYAPANAVGYHFEMRLGCKVADTNAFWGIKNG